MGADALRIFDACVHHRWRDQNELMEHMSAGWREYLGRPGTLPTGGGQIPIPPLHPYRSPDGDVLPGGAPGAPLGSDPAEVAAAVFGEGGAAAALLAYGDGMLTPAGANPKLAAEVARAANDWTTQRWLRADARFRALILVPSQTPDLAAREVDRVARAEPGMVGVLLGANGLGKPFGHPVYRPILAAAAEHGLPVVIQAGGDVVAESPAHATAGGVPTTYAEHYAFVAQPLMTHLVSLIGQGVFEELPELRVLVAGAGVTWLPGLFWRFDAEYRAFRKEAPWVRRPPTAYLHDHVRIALHPLERAPDPEKLHRLLRAFAGMEDLLVFGSGYPRWDTAWAGDVAAQLPAGWPAPVLAANAERLFGSAAVAGPSLGA